MTSSRKVEKVIRGLKRVRMALHFHRITHIDTDEYIGYRAILAGGISAGFLKALRVTRFPDPRYRLHLVSSFAH
jgi:hypothetical protein